MHLNLDVLSNFRLRNSSFSPALCRCLYGPVWHTGLSPLRPPLMGHMACGHFLPHILGNPTDPISPSLQMIISKPAIIFHTSQAFFNFLSMACFASVASFQAKWNVGPCQ